MNKKHLYFLSVMGLLVLRILILNVTGFAEWLRSIHMEKLANICVALRTNPQFLHYMAGWILPVFVFAVLIYWLTEEDEERIPRQFLFLPVVYVIFSLIADTLAAGELTLPMVTGTLIAVLPYGYGYIAVWFVIIWIFKRIRLAR